MRISFSKNDVLILKAVAIIAIALHNFCHNLPYAPGENEFTFDQANWKALIAEFYSQAQD